MANIPIISMIIPLVEGVSPPPVPGSVELAGQAIHLEWTSSHV